MTPEAVGHERASAFIAFLCLQSASRHPPPRHVPMPTDAGMPLRWFFTRRTPGTFSAATR